MGTYLVLHEVVDVAYWLSATTREAAFTPLGVTLRTFSDPGGLEPRRSDRGDSRLPLPRVT
jgi:hypothetical protein